MPNLTINRIREIIAVPEQADVEEVATLAQNLLNGSSVLELRNIQLRKEKDTTQYNKILIKNLRRQNAHDWLVGITITSILAGALIYVILV